MGNKLKIIIASGLYPPDIGGPAQYAKKLTEEFLTAGQEVKVLYYRLEKKMPTGLRHFFYFCRLVFNLSGVDFILALDNFSVGWPAALAAKLFGKKLILRIGGDFLWETYVERSGNLITLRQFYAEKPKLSLKEKIVLSLTKFIFRNCSALVFNSVWQKNIFTEAYGLNPQKTFFVGNYYEIKGGRGEEAKEKNFLWAGRPIKLKNIPLLKEIFDELSRQRPEVKLEIITGLPYQKLLEKLATCYAVILPSLSEMSPNFILDAIGTGRPFIATRETGLYDMLKDIGLFVDPQDREDIRGKINFLLDKENYETAKRKIESFNASHLWPQVAQDFLNIYKKL